MNNLYDLRKKKGVSQKTVAEILGTTPSQYSMLENGKRSITQKNLAILATYFGVSTDTILGKSGVPDALKLTPLPPEYHRIPIVGSVACSWDEGFIDDFDGEYSFINDHLYHKYGDAVRATVARGNSMKEMINPGDLLIVIPAADIENNDIVIATIGDDELTAKKFHYNASGGIDLIPVNPSYGMQSFTPEEVIKLPVKVVARVVEIRKGLRA